jgi:spore coat protein U-like protein
MAVGVEVTANCSVAAGSLAFGSVTAAQAPAQAATAAIEVACGPGVAFTVELDDGQNGGDGTRRARDPATGRSIGYEIFADPAHSRRWGSLDTQSVAGVTTSTGVERLTAYGLIGSDANVASGQYGDLVTVTTHF